jgi:hypothetical protein
MIRFTPFHPGHLRFLRVQSVQTGEIMLVSPDMVAGLRDTLAFSGFVAERCVGCAGIIDVWPGRSQVWALLSAECRPYLLPITKYVLRVLSCHPARRIEATVPVDFDPGCRWLERLGFKAECKMLNYDPTGRTHLLYARLK